MIFHHPVIFLLIFLNFLNVSTAYGFFFSPSIYNLREEAGVHIEDAVAAGRVYVLQQAGFKQQGGGWVGGGMGGLTL